MSELLVFMGAHPFLAAFLAAVAGHVVLHGVNRLLRTVKVLARGWPPEHLDADGDHVAFFAAASSLEDKETS